MVYPAFHAVEVNWDLIWVLTPLSDLLLKEQSDNPHSHTPWLNNNSLFYPVDKWSSYFGVWISKSNEESFIYIIKHKSLSVVKECWSCTRFVTWDPASLGGKTKSEVTEFSRNPWLVVSCLSLEMFKERLDLHWWHCCWWLARFHPHYFNWGPQKIRCRNAPE